MNVLYYVLYNVLYIIYGGTWFYEKAVQIGLIIFENTGRWYILYYFQE